TAMAHEFDPWPGSFAIDTTGSPDGSLALALAPLTEDRRKSLGRGDSDSPPEQCTAGTVEPTVFRHE
ncbi:hypothetical protein, partial [Amycolatopsis sp. NPDC051903]|uniref:hypothetical protein n=1 Tax=Amycolatopsis sp. NPDC051903 TaxID=3363936 RepID=UPI0037B3FC07